MSGIKNGIQNGIQNTNLSLDIRPCPTGGFDASVQGMPFTAHGATREEAAANVSLLAVETMMKEGPDLQELP